MKKLEKQNVIEVTPKKIFGYVLITFAIILFVYLIVSLVLLTTGIFAPITVALSSALAGYDAVAGIVLQLGAYAVLSAISFGIAKTGLGLVNQ